MVTGVCYQCGKAAGAWVWPITPNSVEVKITWKCTFTPNEYEYINWSVNFDHLCGLSRGPGSIPGATIIFWEVVGLELGPLGLVSTTEELRGRKVAATV
jgi:hypothetical protein